MRAPVPKAVALTNTLGYVFDASQDHVAYIGWSWLIDCGTERVVTCTIVIFVDVLHPCQELGVILSRCGHGLLSTGGVERLSVIDRGAKVEPLDSFKTIQSVNMATMARNATTFLLFMNDFQLPEKQGVALVARLNLSPC
jgi:hypothetical protein